MAAPDVWASDLGLAAAQQALDRSGVAPADIDAVIAATCSPDSYFPSIAAIIADGLGAHSAAAHDISAACTGWVYALMNAVTPDPERPRAARAGGGRRDALEGRRLGRPRDLHPVRRRRRRLRDVGRRAARDRVRPGARCRRLARQRPDRRSAARQPRDRDGRRRGVPVRDDRDGRVDAAGARRVRRPHRGRRLDRAAPGQRPDHRQCRETSRRRPVARAREPGALREHLRRLDSAVPRGSVERRAPEEGRSRADGRLRWRSDVGLVPDRVGRGRIREVCG